MKYQYVLFTLAGMAVAGGAGGYGESGYGKGKDDWKPSAVAEETPCESEVAHPAASKAVDYNHLPSAKASDYKHVPSGKASKPSAAHPAAPSESAYDDEESTGWNPSKPWGPEKGTKPSAPPAGHEKGTKPSAAHPASPSESPCDEEEEGTPSKPSAPPAHEAKSSAYPHEGTPSKPSAPPTVPEKGNKPSEVHPASPSETPCDDDEEEGTPYKPSAGLGHEGTPSKPSAGPGHEGTPSKPSAGPGHEGTPSKPSAVHEGTPSKPSAAHPAYPEESPCDDDEEDEEEGTPAYEAKPSAYPAHEGTPSKPSAEPVHEGTPSKPSAAYPAHPEESPCDDDEAKPSEKPYAAHDTPAPAHPVETPAPAYHKNETEPITTGYVPATFATGSRSNSSYPSNTYTPAQQTTNAGSRNGPTIAGLVGLAAAIFLL